MKKVKIKTKQKQKQKQSQTVNINLGELLKKKSNPKRKKAVPPPNISQPITFNAPPIREYVDTSLYNIPSRTDNPLLLRTTTNPIPDIPITIKPISNTVGPIQNNNPLFIEPVKPKSILEPEPVLSFEEAINRSQSYYENNDIETQKELARQNYIREQNILNKKKFNNQLKNNKQKVDIGPSIKITPNQPSASLSQTNIPKFYKIPPQEETILSEPPQQETILSEPQQPQGIDQNIQRPNKIGPILNKFPIFPKKQSIISSSSSQAQTITSELPPQTNLFSELPQQESITSLPIFYQMQTESNLPTEQYVPNISQEETNLLLPPAKGPQKKRPAPEDKKIIRPIKIDPNTGEPIKKPKKQKQNVNLVIQEPPV
jgi:hypothetical protein